MGNLDLNKVVIFGIFCAVTYFVLGIPYFLGPYACMGPRTENGGCAYTYDQCTYFMYGEASRTYFPGGARFATI